MTCEHPHRSAIETALLTGDTLISTVSSEYGPSIAALRRHRDRHMTPSADDIRDAGLESQDIIARLVRLSDRLEDAAALAEATGRISDLVRATDGIRRVDRDLLELTGVRHEEVAARLDLGNAVVKAVGRAARRHPEVLQAVVTELERFDELAIADELFTVIHESQQKGITT